LPCGKRKFDEWGKEGKIMVGILKKLANKIGLLRVWKFSEMAGKIFLAVRIYLGQRKIYR
jgi:hypothetical protein